MQLDNARIAVLAENQYQELELWYPVMRFREAGAAVTIVGPAAGQVYGSKLGYPVVPDVSVDDVDPADFDCVIVPGGFSPESLRRNAGMLDLVRKVEDSGRVVAAICHAGWVLASAGLAKGRRLTCVSVIKDDVINAGAQYVDEPVVRDGNLITSRLPNDLPDFCRVITQALEELPERDASGPSRAYANSSSANYTAAARVRTKAMGPGSANYLMFAAAEGSRSLWIQLPPSSCRGSPCPGRHASGAASMASRRGPWYAGRWTRTSRSSPTTRTGRGRRWSSRPAGTRSR
jgi:protease I